MPEDNERGERLDRRALLLGGSSVVASGTLMRSAQAQTSAAPRSAPAAQGGGSAKPNILVIFGDDIGLWNISFNNRGGMGYRTPNIDRIHAEGATFTDYYGEQSCTAGRAAFITGQSPVRTGLTKVGIPGADIGLRAEDPTIAELLKPLGYATGQFGKNHLGDKDEFLPTITASMSSSGTCTISTRRRSRSGPTIRRISPTAAAMGRVASFTAMPTAVSKIP